MKEFDKRIKALPALLDGAAGTNLIASGMPRGCCPESWMLAHGDVLMDLQRRYMEAGSRIIYAPTFTAQPSRLARFGLEAQTESINERLAALSRRAAPHCLIAGSMTTLTGMVQSEAEMICQYRRQIRGLTAGGVDLLIGETLMSSRDALAILRAAEEERAAPVMLSFALAQDGALRSHEDTCEVFAMLERQGAAALGVNCVPADQRLPGLVMKLKACTNLPLLVKPNAGLSDGTGRIP